MATFAFMYLRTWGSVMPVRAIRLATSARGVGMCEQRTFPSLMTDKKATAYAKELVGIAGLSQRWQTGLDSPNVFWGIEQLTET